MNVGAAQHSCFSLLQLHNGFCGPEHLCQLLALVKSRSLISTTDTLPSNENPGHCPPTRQNAHVILWKKIENFQYRPNVLLRLKSIHTWILCLYLLVGSQCAAQTIIGQKKIMSPKFLYHTSSPLFIECLPEFHSGSDPQRCLES